MYKYIIQAEANKGGMLVSVFIKADHYDFINVISKHNDVNNLRSQSLHSCKDEFLHSHKIVVQFSAGNV